MRYRSPFRTAAAALVFLLAASPAAFARRGGSGDDDGGGSGGGDDKGLVLRVNPAIGAPGGTVAVVLRSYAPRPVRQGQVLIRVVRRARPPKALLGPSFEALTQPLRPFQSLLSAAVYSQRNDSSSQASLAGQPDSQTAAAKFQSPTGTINASDGPLAVFKFRLDPSVQPGQTFDLTLDPAATGLTDGQGRAITLEPRGEALTVRSPRAPYLLEADGDKVEPGEVAELSVNTYEPFLTSGGRVTLTWNANVAGGPPAVLMDSRYGKATYTVDSSKSGRLVVDFKSSDTSFNNVPGSIVSIAMPISATAGIGTRSPFAFDRAETWLLNRRGKRIPIRLENGEIEIR
jgi:hypothetical protein